MDVSSTKSTKTSIIMLSDNCDVLRTYICRLRACEGESNLASKVLITVYDTVAILNVCGTRSTKASIIMLSDNCDLILISRYDCSNIELVQYPKHKGVHYHAE